MRTPRIGLMSESDSRVRRLMPERPVGTDRPSVRPNVPGSPPETLEPAVAGVLDRKALPVVTAAASTECEFVTSQGFYQMT